MNRPAKKPPLRSFRDLGTWKLAHELTVAVYRQCELFPEREGNLLTCQMTQAATIACTNVAESFSNKGEERERLFTSALAALNRLENYLYVALDLGFLNKAAGDDLLRRGSNTRWALVKLQKINREWMEK
jgi:four helix bundle protein